jgi:hypothetical protein
MDEISMVKGMGFIILLIIGSLIILPLSFLKDGFLGATFFVVFWVKEKLTR